MKTSLGLMVVAVLALMGNDAFAAAASFNSAHDGSTTIILGTGITTTTTAAFDIAKAAAWTIGAVAHRHRAPRRRAGSSGLVPRF